MGCNQSPSSLFFCNQSPSSFFFSVFFWLRLPDSLGPDFLPRSPDDFFVVVVVVVIFMVFEDWLFGPLSLSLLLSHEEIEDKDWHHISREAATELCINKTHLSQRQRNPISSITTPANSSFSQPFPPTSPDTIRIFVLISLKKFITTTFRQPLRNLHWTQPSAFSSAPHHRHISKSA